MSYLCCIFSSKSFYANQKNNSNDTYQTEFSWSVLFFTHWMFGSTLILRPRIAEAHPALPSPALIYRDTTRNLERHQHPRVGFIAFGTVDNRFIGGFEFIVLCQYHFLIVGVRGRLTAGTRRISHRKTHTLDDEGCVGSRWYSPPVTSSWADFDGFSVTVGFGADTATLDAPIFAASTAFEAVLSCATVLVGASHI